MLVSDLKFTTFQSKGTPVRACRVEDALTVPTAEGVVTAHPGDYVVELGAVDRQGWLPDGKGGGGPVTTKEMTYGVVSASEFGSAYVVEADEDAVPHETIPGA